MSIIYYIIFPQQQCSCEYFIDIVNVTRCKTILNTIETDYKRISFANTTEVSTKIAALRKNISTLETYLQNNFTTMNETTVKQTITEIERLCVEYNTTYTDWKAGLTGACFTYNCTSTQILARTCKCLGTPETKFYYNCTALISTTTTNVTKYTGGTASERQKFITELQTESAELEEIRQYFIYNSETLDAVAVQKNLTIYYDQIRNTTERWYKYCETNPPPSTACTKNCTGTQILNNVGTSCACITVNTGESFCAFLPYKKLNSFLFHQLQQT